MKIIKIIALPVVLRLDRGIQRVNKNKYLRIAMNIITRKNKYILILFVVSLTFPYLALAKIKIKGYVAASGGFSIAKVGKTQDLNLVQYPAGIPPDHNTYISESNRAAKSTIGLNFGVFLPIYKIISAGIGAGIYQSSYFDAKGKIYQLGNPEYYNMDYKYQLLNTRLVAESRIFVKISDEIIPYLLFSAGSAWNKADKYQEIPTADTHFLPQAFSSNTTTGFTYSFGIGADYSLAEHWRLGLEYQYADWGKGRLGLSPNQNTSDHLETGKITVHSIYFRITYII